MPVFPHSGQRDMLSNLMIFANLGGKWYLSVVLFYISYILNDVKILLL